MRDAVQRVAGLSSPRQQRLRALLQALDRAVGAMNKMSAIAATEKSLADPLADHLVLGEHVSEPAQPANLVENAPAHRDRGAEAGLCQTQGALQ